jgi:hypothetical protein
MQRRAERCRNALILPLLVNDCAGADGSLEAALVGAASSVLQGFDHPSNAVGRMMIVVAPGRQDAGGLIGEENRKEHARNQLSHFPCPRFEAADDPPWLIPAPANA